MWKQTQGHARGKPRFASLENREQLQWKGKWLMTAQSVSERSPVSQEKTGYSVITNSPHLSSLQQGFLTFRACSRYVGVLRTTYHLVLDSHSIWLRSFISIWTHVPIVTVAEIRKLKPCPQLITQYLGTYMALGCSSCFTLT